MGWKRGQHDDREINVGREGDSGTTTFPYKSNSKKTGTTSTRSKRQEKKKTPQQGSEEKEYKKENTAEQQRQRSTQHDAVTHRLAEAVQKVVRGGGAAGSFAASARGHKLQEIGLGQINELVHLIACV